MEMLLKSKSVAIKLHVLTVLFGLVYSMSGLACDATRSNYGSDYGFLTGRYVSDLETTYSDNEYPGNIKGAIYHSKGSVSAPYPSNGEFVSLRMPKFIKGQYSYKLFKDRASLPLPLQAKQFSILDQTTGESLTPRLVRLTAPDDYIDSQQFFHFSEKYRYFVFNQNKSQACIAREEHARKYHYLRNNGCLDEVTENVKKAAGYFRVEAEEGLKPGHRYYFTYSPKKREHIHTTNLEATIHIKQKPLALLELTNIEPIEYEVFNKPLHASGEPCFIDEHYAYFRPEDWEYDWFVKYYIPKPLHNYQNKLRFVPLSKLSIERKFRPPFQLNDEPHREYNRNQLKLFDLKRPVYSTHHNVCHESKAVFAFLEIEDKFYESQTIKSCGSAYE